MRWRLSAVFVCVLALSACSRGQGLETGSSLPTTQRLAPAVPRPVNVTRYVAQPCAVVRKSQPIARDLPEGTADGNTCTWRARTPQQPEVVVTVDTTSGGLEALYRQRAQFPLFEPLDVAGFPAVHTDKVYAAADQGTCTVHVGVSDDAVITVTSTIADSTTLNYPVPCPDADAFANAVITTVAGAA